MTDQAPELGDLEPNHNQSLKEMLALMEPAERDRILDGLTPTEMAAIMDSWRFTARPDQLAPEPEHPWLWWLLLGGRGSGKSRSVCEWAHERIEDHYLAHERGPTQPLHRLGAAGRTSGDIREVLVEGESGLMAVAEARGVAAKYEPSKRRITWPDLNARATLYTAEEPDNARGPQHHTIIGDEFAAWDFSITDDIGNNLWTNLLMGLRLGDTPQAALATTPKRIPLLREMVEDALDDDNFLGVMSSMTSLDNAGNLSSVFIDKIVAQYEGTKLYRQEVLGLLLDADEDMLWSEADIARAHRYLETPGSLGEYAEVVIGVDPPGGLSRDHCGIIAVARLAKPLPGMAYKCVAVVADRSRKGSPEQWGRTVVDLCNEFGTRKVVAEQNQGFEMVRSVIRNADQSGAIQVELVNARDSKILRAEPVSHLYEQGRVVHAQRFPLLEDEMVMWAKTMKDSPDRLDALVHAVTHILPSINQRPASLSVADMSIQRARAAAEDAFLQANGTRPSAPHGGSGLSSLYLPNRGVGAGPRRR